MALDETAIDLLGAELDSRDVNARRNAIESLGRVDGEKKLALIEKMLNDQNVVVRGDAVSIVRPHGR
ncbi:MAG: HEAT repeat domain-containing protein [Planctomycetota bacterium]